MDIILSATRSSWQLPMQHGTHNDKNVEKYYKAVLERDNYTCQGCNFKSIKYQEIHPINQQHSDMDINNLVTLCPFCHQCYHLNTASYSNGGSLIWLPELSQVELHHLVRGIFIALTDEKNPYYQIAKQLYLFLENRKSFIDNNFSEGASNPALLGQVFLKMPKENYERRGEFLTNIKLLPTKERFEQQIKYWKEKVYHDIPFETWTKLLQSES